MHCQQNVFSVAFTVTTSKFCWSKHSIFRVYFYLDIFSWSWSWKFAYRLGF